jgi:hypothetical protein
MEEEWVVCRSKLREVWVEHPEWSRQKMGDEMECSKSWVKKWLKRIRGAPMENQDVLRGKSCMRKRPPPPMEPKIVDKILEIRDHPPQQLGRIPGPLAILYYLNQDSLLKEAGYKLPRSTRTIWKVLTKYHRIYTAPAVGAGVTPSKGLPSRKNVHNQAWNGGWIFTTSPRSRQTQRENNNT